MSKDGLAKLTLTVDTERMRSIDKQCVIYLKSFFF